MAADNRWQVRSKLIVRNDDVDDVDVDVDDDDDDKEWKNSSIPRRKKQPCYAFQRGNIVFTTHAPISDYASTNKRRGGKNIPKRDESPSFNPLCKSTCSIKLIDTAPLRTTVDDVRPDENATKIRTNDLCEVCCGMRSPNSTRRAHSYTTHFCTRIPAKFAPKGRLSRSSSSSQMSSSQMSSSDYSSGGNHMRSSANSTCVTTSSSSLAGADDSNNNNNNSNVNNNGQNHVSRLRAFLEGKCSGKVSDKGRKIKTEEVFITDNMAAGCAVVADGTQAGGSSCAILRRNILRYRNTENSCADSAIVTTSTSTSTTTLYRSSFGNSTSLYPSVRNSFSYLSVGGASCTSSASSILSSRSCICCDNSVAADSSDEFANDYREDATIRTRGPVKWRGSSDDSDDKTCSSEMGWSFSSLCEHNPFYNRNKMKDAHYDEFDHKAVGGNDAAVIGSGGAAKGSSSNRKSDNNNNNNAISPFTLNENRKQNVAVKFGTIVDSFRKPGHHVGPIKNPDCFCDNCTYFYKTANSISNPTLTATDAASFD